MCTLIHIYICADHTHMPKHMHRQEVHLQLPVRPPAPGKRRALQAPAASRGLRVDHEQRKVDLLDGGDRRSARIMANLIFKLAKLMIEGARFPCWLLFAFPGPSF